MKSMGRALQISIRWMFPLLLSGLALAAAWRLAGAQSGRLRISYLNVGQGDSALIQGPDGFDILIDGGDTDVGPTVVAYLAQAGVTELEVVLASHNDADHIGGLVDVLQAGIPVGQVYYNGYPSESDLFAEFATAAAVAGAPLQPANYPAEYTWGSSQASILHPLPGATGTPEQNNLSVVALVEYGSQRFLFPGDLEKAGEAELLARGTPPAALALKVGHHGSDTSTSPEFLAAVQPGEAVISVGGDNPFGHPDPTVLARLDQAGARIWRTDRNGTIWLESDGWEYTIAAELMNPLRLPLVARNRCVTAGLPALQITTIFYNGVAGSQEPDEFVEIANFDRCPLQLAGYSLHDSGTAVYNFPTFVMAPGQVCRVYTNQDHPEWCGFNWGRGSATWGNNGECGTLWDNQDNRLDEFCYPP